MKKESTTEGGEVVPSDVDFHFIKSPQYRSIYVDGAWGGVTPRGMLSLTLYAERFPVPKRITFAVTSEGLERELDRDSREGVVREVEATAFLDLRAAVSLHAWLQEKIPELASRTGVELEVTSTADDERGDEG